jgi:hypothetical protein
MFVTVNIVLPAMGFALALACLIMDLIFSLKSERTELDAIKDFVKEQAKASESITKAHIASVETRISRLESQRIF